MKKLIDPNTGITVEASDYAANRLIAQGWQEPAKEPETPATGQEPAKEPETASSGKKK
jgi:hypothetical protein